MSDTLNLKTCYLLSTHKDAKIIILDSVRGVLEPNRTSTMKPFWKNS